MKSVEERIDLILNDGKKTVIYDCRACPYKKCKERASKGMPANCTLKKEGRK